MTFFSRCYTNFKDKYYSMVRFFNALSLAGSPLPMIISTRKLILRGKLLESFWSMGLNFEKIYPKICLVESICTRNFTRYFRKSRNVQSFIGKPIQRKVHVSFVKRLSPRQQNRICARKTLLKHPTHFTPLSANSMDLSPLELPTEIQVGCILLEDAPSI